MKNHLPTKEVLFKEPRQAALTGSILDQLSEHEGWRMLTSLNLPSWFNQARLNALLNRLVAFGAIRVWYSPNDLVTRVGFTTLGRQWWATARPDTLNYCQETLGEE